MRYTGFHPSQTSPISPRTLGAASHHHQSTWLATRPPPLILCWVFSRGASEGRGGCCVASSSPDESSSQPDTRLPCLRTASLGGAGWRVDVTMVSLCPLNTPPPKSWLRCCLLPLTFAVAHIAAPPSIQNGEEHFKNYFPFSCIGVVIKEK